MLVIKLKKYSEFYRTFGIENGKHSKDCNAYLEYCLGMGVRYAARTV